MAAKRKHFEGVSNIVRFNWPFYVAAGVILSAVFFSVYLYEPIRIAAFLIGAAAALTIIISLAVSFYIYDISDLYDLNWLVALDRKKVLNVNAGFDETSSIIRDRFPECRLTVCDFYDAEKHTEASIRRARRAYPPGADAVAVSTRLLPFSDDSFDLVLAIFSVHEIRDASECVSFFRELRRILKPGGAILVTEHVRDLPNFLAYTVGSFHFYPRSIWLQTFEAAGLSRIRESKTTPFITTFTLEKHGN